MKFELSTARLGRPSDYSVRGLSLALVAAILLHAMVYLAWFGHGGSGSAKTANLGESRISLALRSPTPNLLVLNSLQELVTPSAFQLSSEQHAMDAVLTQKREKYRHQERKLEKTLVQAQNDLPVTKSVPPINAEPAVADSPRLDQIFGQEGKLIQCVNEQGQTYTVIVPPGPEGGALLLQPQSADNRDPCVQG